MLSWIADRINRARAARAQKRALDIASTPAWLASWSRTASTLNNDIYLGLADAVTRARGLVRNNDWARGFIIQLKTNVLGPTGIRLQMRMVKRDGAPHDALNDAVESGWAEWGRRGNCEVTERLTWREVERLLLEGLARDGEILVRHVRGRGPHRYQVQILDPMLLDPRYNLDLPDGRRIRMSVEIDAEGRALAYHLRNQARPELDVQMLGHAIGDYVRVPADDILHRFVSEEACQLRGYPWLAAGARRLFLVRDYEDAASVAASNAAKRLGFFVSPNGEAPPGMADQIVSSVLDQAKAQGKVMSADEIQELTTAAHKFATTVPGTFDTLPTGYDFKAFESEYPHTGHGEFVKACLRGVASGLGRSYVTMGNDLESVNYSSARVGILDERETYKGIQSYLAEALHEDILAAWLPFALLAAPALSRVDPARMPELLAAATWQPRRWAGIDPVKEAVAAETNLALKLTSRRRLILERGEDPDEVWAEIEEEDARLGPVVPTGAAAEALDPEDDADDEPAEPARPARARAHLVRVRALEGTRHAR